MPYYKNYIRQIEFIRQLNTKASGLQNKNSSKRVLICIHSFEWGGAERFAFETISYLIEKGIDFHVFVEKKVTLPHEFINTIDSNKITYANEYQKSPKQLLDLIHVYKPNILHIHHSYSNRCSYVL